MKIAFVTDVIYPFTIGGSEIRNYEIAKRLVKMGHEIHIFGAKLWEGKDNIEIDGIKIHGVQKYERLYKKNGKRSVFIPAILSIKIFFELLKNNFDTIDVTAFTFFNCYSVKVASLIKKTPIVITWQQYFGDYLTGYFGRTKGTLARILEFFSTKLTKNNLAVSSFVASELRRRGIKKENIKIIYNGTDIKLINTIKNQEKLYDLIFVGRLNYQKNLPLLVESVKILKKDFPNIKIAIVGKGEEKEKLEGLIKNYGLSENFKFFGEIKEKEKLFSILKSAKIFVLPSILEGFPLTIVEANACGLPIVTTKTKHNNVAEYLKENENGFLCPANPENFAGAISYLLKNPDVLAKTSRFSVQKSANFGWDEIARSQEQYYKSLKSQKVLMPKK